MRQWAKSRNESVSCELNLPCFGGTSRAKGKINPPPLPAGRCTHTRATTHSDQLLPLPPQNPCARAIMAVEAWVEESEPRYTHAKKQPGLPVRSLPYCSSPTYRTRPPSERDNPSPQAADVTAHAAQKRLPMRLISMRLREGPPQTRRPMPAPIRLRPSDCRCGAEAAAEAAPMVPS